MTKRTWQCSLDLPADFRSADVLAFHARDAEGLAEKVEAAGLHKGLVWNGLPARLSIRFEAGRAHACLAADGVLPADDSALPRLVRRMLGLEQDITAFERALADHPLLGPLIARNPGLRVPQAAAPFEALGWAVIGQQISLGTAISVRRKFIRAAAIRHSSGLWCYPEARRIAAMGEDVLRGAGFSRGKARTLCELSALVETRGLPLDGWLEAPPVETIRQGLLAIRGIGPWTVSYVLLRGYGWLDGSLHGDAALRRNLQALLGRTGKIGEDEARRWLEEFSPWRALLAAHLWAMQQSAGY